MCYLRSRGHRKGRACEVVTLPVAGCRPGSNRAERIGTRLLVAAALMFHGRVSRFVCQTMRIFQQHWVPKPPGRPL